MRYPKQIYLILVLASILTNCARINAFYNHNMLITHLETKEYNKAQQLIESGVDVNYTNKASIDKRTALHHAARSGNVIIVNSLILAGAQINVQDEQGNTPMHYAIDSGNIDTISLLIKSNAALEVRNNEGEASILRTCSTKLPNNIKEKMFVILLEANANIDVVNNKNQNLLFCDFILSNNELLNIVLAKGLDVNQASIFSPYYPLLLAARETNVDAISSLVQAGAKIDVTSSLTHNGDIANINNLALHIIAGLKITTTDSEKIVPLLSNGNSNLLNQTNSLGDTPLHIAASTRNIHIFKSLMSNGASTNIKNPDGKTAMDILKTFDLGEYNNNILPYSKALENN